MNVSVKSIDPMGGMEFEENGSVPLLRLHNWADSVLPISLFTHGTLSASRSRLALLSRKKQVVLVPLGSSKDGEDLPSVVPSPVPTSFEETEAPSTPKQAGIQSFEPAATPSSTGFRFSVGHEPGATPSSTGFRFSFGGSYSPRRLSKAFLTPYTATPYFTPSASTPLWTASPTLQPQPSPAKPKVPSSFPIIDDIECVAWACYRDEFAANSDSGPFREILFTAGSDGLALHAFCYENGGEDGDCKGEWRNWRDSSDDFSGKRRLSFSTNEARKESRLDGDSSFVSFVVDGRLEPCESGDRKSVV